MTAFGNFLKADSNEYADLYWGLRGGGGNFGVVASFEYRLHPVKAILGGMVLFEMKRAREGRLSWSSYGPLQLGLPRKKGPIS